MSTPPNQPGNPPGEPPWGWQPPGYRSQPNPPTPPPGYPPPQAYPGFSGHPGYFGYPGYGDPQAPYMAAIRIGNADGNGVIVWGIVDAILIFTGSVKDNHGRKLR